MLLFCDLSVLSTLYKAASGLFDLIIGFILGGGVWATYVYWRLERDSIRPEVTRVISQEGKDVLVIEPLGRALTLNELLGGRLRVRLLRKAGKVQVQCARELEKVESASRKDELSAIFLRLDRPERQKELLLAGEGVIAQAAQPWPLVAAGESVETRRTTFHYFYRRDTWTDDQFQTYRLIVVPDELLRRIDDDPYFLSKVTPLVEHTADRLDHIRALYDVVRGGVTSGVGDFNQCVRSVTLSLPALKS